MTILQKQCLLLFLGYDTGGADGIWGQKSRQATDNFRADRGRQATGELDRQDLNDLLSAIHQECADPWENIRWFQRQEFACRCGRCGGFPKEPEMALVELAEQVREHFDRPVIVSSGVRCPEHNMVVGGVANSRHLTGKAMDFQVAGKGASEVLAYIKALPRVRYCYGIDANFVHMDVD